jgi:hypothetical protein
MVKFYCPQKYQHGSHTNLSGRNNANSIQGGIFKFRMLLYPWGEGRGKVGGGGGNATVVR